MGQVKKEGTFAPWPSQSCDIWSGLTRTAAGYDMSASTSASAAGTPLT
jgi:hypothetical protein